MEPSPPITVDDILVVHALEGGTVSVSRSCGCRWRYHVLPETAAPAIAPSARLRVVAADVGDGRLTVLLERPTRGTPIQGVRSHRYFLHGGLAGALQELACARHAALTR